MKKDQEQNNLSTSLRALEEIVEWFESQEEVDVEEALRKVRSGAELIKFSRSRLREVENEFEEIREQLQEKKEEH